MLDDNLYRLVARHRARTHAFGADFLRRDQEGDVSERILFMNTSDRAGIPAYDNPLKPHDSLDCLDLSYQSSQL
jgi:hypothetical protein